VAALLTFQLGDLLSLSDRPDSAKSGHSTYFNLQFSKIMYGGVASHGDKSGFNNDNGEQTNAYF